MIVVDSSAIVEWLLRLPRAEAVEARLSRQDETLHAPHFVDVEVAQVLRRLTPAGAVREERSRQALDDLADLDLVRHPHDVLLPVVWRLRDNLTAYDGVYVALAEVLDAPLLTLDARLAAAPGHRARIEVVG
ncbi:type II toxin-antitoxin system VapC family toxin [Egicoccus sp. AB-alg2]|uniref:type II toxin-antitoxin system VapC family toxin n=1 Tax=Egicoccus sp. AB-alg2 TaxID=3242693 RepID=UPI00359D82D7